MKWEKAEAKRREAHAKRTPDQIRQSLVDLEWIRDGGSQDGVSLGTLLAVAMSGRDSFDMAKIDAEIAAEEALLDAEYKRQFPNGPELLFSAKTDNPDDMELLKKVFGREALEHAFGPDGGGIAEVEQNAAEARAAQSARR